MDSSDFEESDLPDSIRRLIDPTGGVGVCLYDVTSIGHDYQGAANKDNIENDDDDDYQIVVTVKQFTASDGIAVNQLSLSMFRFFLINNFNNSFHKNLVVWPTRFAKQLRHVPTTPITHT